MSKEVNKRYALAVDVYHNNINILIVEQQKQQLKQLIQQADLCTQIESTTNASDEISNEFKERWLTLNENNVNKSQLSKRYEKALKSISDDQETLIQTELDDKQKFCLKYEILLGKETPVEDQKSRMEMQVELLNSNLGRNNTENPGKDQISTFELQLEWYKISNYSQNKKLDDRFKKLIAS